ncbi:Uncharacterized protein TCM_004414 [Theobroma cacao]|uniref:RNase H type-1 domain-containing protein n=1 Tax=Theobroma cacao TaxID=3641 RepID=A0A061DXR4_THECC|nr:Uncharacterized protein TCM_004414 [Theobroma cacao]
MGGRITLLKTILNSLHLFHMSLFQTWDAICNLGVFGGLGLVDVGLKNRAFLNKWLWHYDNEPKSMWRRIVVIKSGLDLKKILLERGALCKASSMWKNITKPPCGSYDYSSFVTEGIGLSLDGFIDQFGGWIDNKWRWNIELCRNIFGWERDQWESFNNLINVQTLNINFQDLLIWKGSPLGNYSPNSFCRQVLTSQSHPTEHWKHIWFGLAPLKIECLCWQILHGRLVVKDVLTRRGIIGVDSDYWGALWNIHLVYHNDPRICFLSWLDVAGSLNNGLIWRMAWFQNVGTTPARCKQTSNTISWSKPLVGSLSFNIDGASRGCSGDSEIGGILRNEHGDVLILFSKSIGVCDSNKTELMAVREAALIYPASRWCTSHSLFIESDKQNVVNWITSPNKVPWRLRQLIAQTLNILGKIKKWDIKHTMGLANNEADTLAKEGVLRTVDFSFLSLDVGSAQEIETAAPLDYYLRSIC